jgi:hypothetical protein
VAELVLHVLDERQDTRVELPLGRRLGRATPALARSEPKKVGHDVGEREKVSHVVGEPELGHGEVMWSTKEREGT